RLVEVSLQGDAARTTRIETQSPALLRMAAALLPWSPKLFELHLVGTPRRPEDRQRPSGSRGNNDADQGLSPLAVRAARAGRLRSRGDLLEHDRREGRARADARRRRDRDRRLSPGHDGKAPCPAGVLDSQQGPPRPRGRRGVADASGLVDAVDWPGGS